MSPMHVVRGPSARTPVSAAAATKTATAPVRISASSSSPTAWAATSPARSPRASRSKRSRPSSQETAGADKNRTWPFPFEPALSLEGNRLKAAFRLANRRIASAMADSARPARHGDDRLGASSPDRDGACVAHVGDSRVYVLRDGTLEQITDDHSWVEEQVRAGTMTRDGGAAASVAQRRDARAVGRRRSGSRRHRAQAASRASASCSVRTACSRVVPTSRSPTMLGDATACARRDLPAADRRGERGGGPDNITALVLQVDAP